MVQTATQLMSLDQFLDWHPNDGSRFELFEGVPIEMNPTGKHEKVAGFLSGILFVEAMQRHPSYFVPKTATVKPYRDKSGYKPDVVVLNQESIAAEPRWEKQSTIIQGESIALAIEVVSTNWRDDYGLKLNDYEEMKIPEYWIVDYLGLGAIRYIGSPRQPTLSIYTLVDSEYQLQQFRGSEQIISPAFPHLLLTAAQVFASEK